MAQQIVFSIVANGTAQQRAITVDQLVIAGWAGRDHEALENHINELEREGIPRPARTPEFYRVGVNLLTTDPAVEVPGDASSGEIEAFILKAADELWVGIGSDHTDRQLEATSVVMSKQACPKPIGTTLWSLSEIRGHWDEIQISSSRYEGDERIAYQQGMLSANLTGEELLERYEAENGLIADGTLMFCGTIPAIGGIRFSHRFEMEMHDPVRDLYIRHAYDIFALPADQVRAP